MPTFSMQEIFIARMQSAANAKDWRVRLGFGTPGMVVQTPMGRKDTGQVWTDDSQQTVDAQQIGAILDVIVDKVNELAADSGGSVSPIIEGDFTPDGGYYIPEE